ncbi:GNAT family N-acetyltransferase [Guptibacillus hwajinpoensis]|uniref:GNAT family N-acetyltransferase n=1 Tax=Guptibacillus hwajinpoensis TaxID=208199 RepID=UPI001CFE780E|nr:GNAT family protein [Pseudalkalibacillus hwajinpoensis]WLR59937.1 GNAT family protein [Pseudalkalibacillus hwajinpoensis]
MIYIEKKKVTLREATWEDISTLYYWKYEEKNQEAKKWNGPYIIEKKISKVEYKKEWEQQREISLGVPDTLVIEADNKVIGTVGSYWVDKFTDWLETGIVIYDPSYWSGGYGSEAYREWIHFLFRSTKLHRLGMSTWSGNERMIKVARKVGMKEEARIRDARIVEGVYYDAIKMGMLRSEWEELRS